MGAPVLSEDGSVDDLTKSNRDKQRARVFYPHNLAKTVIVHIFPKIFACGAAPARRALLRRAFRRARGAERTPPGCPPPWLELTGGGCGDGGCGVGD